MKSRNLASNVKKSQREEVRPRKQCGHLCVMRDALIAWFDAHKRDLPWRRTRDPYAIWLSEMMLQQTQVVTVIPYFERFMARFPTVRDLAAADLNEVLKLWAGLGYYARARNLFAAAKVISEQYLGRVPDTVKALLELPGVGAYTAGAIASIAYGRKAAVVDGNVARVVARLFSIKHDVRAGEGRSYAWRMAERLLPEDRCGDHNQALMELGATICLPRDAAQCLICPLRKHCRACKEGKVNDLPVRTRKVAVKSETHVVAAISSDDKWLFVRRPEKGLWGGLWELPTVLLNGSKPASSARMLAAQYCADIKPISKEPFCRLSKQLTHRTIMFVGYCFRSTQGMPTALTFNTRPEDVCWKTLDEITTLGVSSAMQAVCKALKQDENQVSNQSRRLSRKCF